MKVDDGHYFQIEDREHAEISGPFADIEQAMVELRRLAAIPWNKPPNKAPCTKWRTCGRDLVLIEATGGGPTFTPVQWAAALRIEAAGAIWSDGGEGMSPPTEWTPGRWYTADQPPSRPPVS